MSHRKFGELHEDAQMYADRPDGTLDVVLVPAGRYEFVAYDVPGHRKLLGLGLQDPLRTPWTVIRGTTVGGPTGTVRAQCGGAFEFIASEQAARLFVRAVGDLRALERGLAGLETIAERRTAQADIAVHYLLVALFAHEAFSNEPIDAIRYVQRALLQACMAHRAAAEHALARKALRRAAFLSGNDVSAWEAMFDRMGFDLFGDRQVLVGDAVVNACLDAANAPGIDRHTLFVPMRPKAAERPRWWGLVDAAEQRRVHWGDDEGRVTLEGIATFLAGHGVRVDYDTVERVARQPGALVGPATLRVCAHVCRLPV